MNTDKSVLMDILDEMKIIIEGHSNSDGTLKMDVVKARVALEFAKTTLEEAIEK